jgi:hypothetical protein
MALCRKTLIFKKLMPTEVFWIETVYVYLQL